MEEFSKIEKANKKSKRLNIIIIALVLLILGIGVSYAQWNYNFIGSLTNSISTESVELEFLESKNNIVDLTNALPKTDEEGKYTNTFNFAVTSKTKKNTDIGYTLSIEKLEADTGYTFLEDSDIKIYLEDYEGNVLLEPTKVSELDNYKFYSNIHEHSTTNEEIQDMYKLRVWVDESKTEEAKNWDTSTKIQYKFKVKVTSEEVTNPITVTFDANGGTTPVASKKVSTNGLYGELPTPTRSGYTFKGWNGKNLLNLEQYPVDDELVRIANESVTIYKTDNYFQFAYSDDNFPLIHNAIYTISTNIDGEFTGRIYGFFGYSLWSYWNGKTTFTYYNTDDKGRLYVSQNTNNNTDINLISNSVTFSKIQLEEGSTATPYEPYYLTPSTKVVQTSNHTLKAIWEQNS